MENKKKDNRIHIGKLIKEQVEKQQIKVSDFAKKIYCVRENVYNIYDSPTMEINHLIEIGEVLNYDFIEAIYIKRQQIKNEPVEIKTDPTEITLCISLSKIQNEEQYLYILNKMKEIAAVLQTPEP